MHRLIALAVALAPSTLLAHEGHGTVGEGHTVEHYASEPIHVAMLVGLIVVAGTIAAIALRVRRSVHEAKAVQKRP